VAVSALARRGLSDLLNALVRLLSDE
jgi:hypothetical protein